MSDLAEESHETYVYRRVSPTQFNAKKNEVTPDLFALGTAARGLSVYHASIVTPREALRSVIEDKRKQLASTEDVVRVNTQKWLHKYPDVESLVAIGWRIVKLPVSEIIAMGFGLGEPDAQGHLNILGERSRFDDHIADFAELLKVGKARLLTKDECLQID